MTIAHVKEDWRTYEQYVRALPTTYAVIVDLIDAAGARHPEVTFRPDARQFLLVNMVELVAKPQTAVLVNGELHCEMDGTTLDRFRRMIETIVAEASTRPDDRGEISGHQVLAAVDRVWHTIRMGTWTK